MRQRFAAMVCVLAALVVLCACTPSKPASIVGAWSAPDTAGKNASLSELALSADGTFRYGGKNALGGPVAFTGTYQTGTDSGTPWLKLVYADFPDRPTVWFYRIEGDRLSVSSVRGNLDNGSALTFVRKGAP